MISPSVVIGVGISEAAAIDRTPVEVVDFKIPVESEEVPGA
jgi:hypothetical protein